MAYLDYNATAPVREPVVAAMTAALSVWGNPSSVHGYGRAARQIVEQARAEVAALVGAEPRQVVFTSGGTEANNLALGGTGRQRILVTATEHVSVLDVVPSREVLPVSRDGLLDRDRLGTALADGPPALVAVMLANNETGVLQPVAEIAAAAHAAGALVHCDAVQAVGRVPVDFAAIGADLLSLSAHKIGGPKGVGALIVGEGVALAGCIRGGGQERGLRAGTENVAAIAGFGAAARLAREELPSADGIAKLRDVLESRARREVPGVTIPGSEVPRIGNTSCLAMPGIKAETQVMALDLAGVAVSAGAACSSGKVRRSHVLTAMGYDDAVAGSAIRVSLGPESKEADIGRFLAAWRDLYERARTRAAWREQEAACVEAE